MAQTESQQDLSLKVLLGKCVASSGFISAKNCKEMATAATEYCLLCGLRGLRLLVCRVLSCLGMAPA